MDRLSYIYIYIYIYIYVRVNHIYVVGNSVLVIPYEINSDGIHHNYIAEKSLILIVSKCAVKFTLTPVQ